MADNTLPTGAIPLVKVSAQGANSIVSANLTGLTNTTVYLTGLTVVAGGATSAAMTSLQVTGLANVQTLALDYGVVAGAGVPSPTLDLKFNPPQPASAPNTAITAHLGALGSGNTNARIVLQGFHL